MAKDELYAWNQERALEMLKTRRLICRVCGQTVTRYPNEVLLRHILTHVQGAKRKEIEELIAYFSDPENRYRYAISCLSEMDQKDVEEFIDMCSKYGIAIQVPEEK